MTITVSITNPDQFEALLKWLWQNQLLEKTIVDRSQEFMDAKADDDDFWMKISSETLRDLWDSPEEDYWDKLYVERDGQPENSEQINSPDLLPEK